MISISGKYWEELKVEKRLIDKAKIDHNLNTTQAKLIISRNFTEEELLSIRYNTLFSNPFLKSDDFLKACELLKINSQFSNQCLKKFLSFEKEEFFKEKKFLLENIYYPQFF